MKRLLFFALICFTATGVTTGCRFVNEEPLGDTVASSVFAPDDTKKHTKKKIAEKVAEKDSTDIFYIGTGSDGQYLQLVSYPSRRDTFKYGKTAHIHVEGCADTGRIVRVAYFILPSGDSLVSKVIEKKQ